tara:strand:+ start:5745 stop:6557 length:813 start_codon:yes stop_codon:yes gene_type:complete
MNSFDSNDKSDKKKGWTATISIHTLLLVLFSFIGLNYQAPPPEMGIPINFGYDQLDQSIPANENITSQSSEPKKTVDESPEVQTQNLTESIKLNEENTNSSKKTSEKEIDSEREKNNTSDMTEEKPKVNNELSKRLNDRFNNNSTESSSAKNQIGKGMKGKQNGDLRSLEKNIGSGVLGFSLGSRKSIGKIKGEGNCGVKGLLVLNVWVNNQGIPYKIGNQPIKGTTITENLGCAVKTARDLLKTVRWEADVNNTYKQGVKIPIEIPFDL